MSATQMKFERCEKKYILSVPAYKQLAELLVPQMEIDRYGLCTVSSLYYDTDDYRIIRASAERPVYKEKLRLRAYGTPARDSTVYLELKKKLEGVVYKRRIALPLREAALYLDHGVDPGQDSQIFREIDWFVRRYRPRAKVLLGGDRLALYGKDDPELRITFDFKLRWRDYNLDLAQGSLGQNLLPPDQCLMEIKARQAIPIWLARLLSERELYPCSFSKYGICYKNHILSKGEIRHAG